MIQMVMQHLDKILVIAGAMTVLFWPKIKAAISAGGTKAPSCQTACQTCPYCTPPKPEEPVSTWVNRQLEVRDYCERRGLKEAVKSCDAVITEMISGEPTNKMATPTKKV
jgi:hypothetical protein